MIAEISLAIIAAMLVMLVGSFIFLFFKIHKVIREIQTDFHHVSHQTTELIGHLNKTMENIEKKPHLVNFVLNSLSFFGKKKETDQSNQGSAGQGGTVLPLIDWMKSGLSLIKQTKEFFSHDKSK